MSQELVVKSKTEIAKQASEKDILSFYEKIPAMFDQIIEEEKNNFLNSLSSGAIILDSLNKLSNIEEFTIEIPSELREMFKSGEAMFDKSSKNPNSFTPNIRVKGKNGIKGQITIDKNINNQAIIQTMSNLAMFMMLQSILKKLDVIEGKIEDVKKGQENDRVGSIIGCFKGFIDLYPTFKSIEELNNAATTTYMKMQDALAQLHLQIEENRKKLDGAPTNDWQAIWVSITTFPNLFSSEIEKKYEKYYQDYIYSIQLYNRLILLSDVVLFLKLNGNDEAIEAIKKNHKTMMDYCEHHIDDTFKQNMEYLMGGETQGITDILNYNKNFSLGLADILNKDLKIECKQIDVKFFINN